MIDNTQPGALLPPDIFGCDPAVIRVDAATTQQLVLALKIQHAELETLREKLKTYEDLGDAADDVQLLRMGYAAARLEIESLRAAQPVVTPQPGAAYAALPEYGINTASHAHFRVLGFTADQMHAFADATHALRASHGQVPAAPKGDIDD